MSEERQRITLASRKDFDVSYFVGPGHGGQNKQKCHTGVHIIHRETGAFGRASDSRSQEQNKKAAFERLREHPRMKVWLNKKLFELREQETIEDAILRTMTAANLRYEVKVDGKWTVVPDSYFEKDPPHDA